MFMIFASIASAKTEEKRCRAGYELHGDLCRKWEPSRMVPWCDKGDLVEGICVVDYEPFAMCIGDGTLSDGMCEHYHVESPITFCPDGYEIEFGKKKEYQYCAKLEPQALYADCPDGTVEVGPNCLSYEIHQPSYTCPGDTVLEGEYCVTTEFYDCTQPAFPHGISKKKYPKTKEGHHGGKHRRLGEKKDDEHHLPVVEVWEKEDIVVDSVCERVSKVGAVSKCPDGTFREGKSCKKQIFVKREMVQSFSHHRVPVESACPQPYEWCNSKKKHFDGSCCAVELQKPVLDCPTGTIMTKRGCIAKFEPAYICADGKKKKKHDSCSEYIYEEPTIVVVAHVEEKKKKHGGHGHGHH